MYYLSIKYQLENKKSSRQIFQPEDHLRIFFYFGLPFVDYSKYKKVQ